MLGSQSCASSDRLRMLFSTFSVLCFAAQCLAQEPQIPLGHHHAVQKLKWEDCSSVWIEHTLQCATLEVPMDHFGPPSDKIFTIPLIRMIATNASANGDRHIFINPGGPGGSGVGIVRVGADYLSDIIGEDFHLLGFDPRGVQGSRPNASCYPDNQQRTDAVYNNPWHVEFQAGQMYTNAENKARACQDMMGEHGKYINTPQTAADMNSILDALGQDELYYWGFSYGTTLGQTYAQMFPDRVGRVAIDGVSNLDNWYKSAFDEEAFSDTDTIFAGFIEECLKHKNECPLASLNGTDFDSPNELKKYMQDYLLQLEEEPIPVYINPDLYGSITRQILVTYGIFFALYGPSIWASLADDLADLINGNSIPAFLEYSPHRVADFIGDDSNTFVVHNDIKQTGKDFPVHGIQDIRNYTLSIPQPSKLVSAYYASDIFMRASWRIETTHTFQPRYSHEYPPVKTAHPLLILSTTYDPVCPLVSAMKAWKSFEGAGIVEQKSYGHCTLSMPSLCTAKHLRRYFNEGKVPDNYTTCEIDREYFVAELPELSALSQEDQKLLKSLDALSKTDNVIFPWKF
ncbi:alpha/beta-hydrolase [Sarocladium strictum]